MTSPVSEGMLAYLMHWLIQRQLKSKNAASRRKAAQRLCDAPHPHALGALGEALGDEDAEVRVLAATALGKLEVEDRLEPLFRALRDRDGEVQKAAILALKKTSDDRVPAALLPLLRHPNAGVRGCAAQVLEFVGWHPAKPEEEMWFLVAKGQCSRVAAFGAAALVPLEMVLNAGPYSLCVAAVQALGEIEDQRTIRLLLKALRSNDATVCVAAVASLARVGGEQASEPLIGMLQHKNGQVRVAAVEALGSLGVAAAAAPLRALLSDPVWEVRRTAVETLVRLKDEGAVEPLTRALADKDTDVREATALALGALCDRRAIGPLVLALKDSTSGVRRIAAAALSRIDENWSASAEARAAVEELKPALYDRDPDVRYFVGQFLVSLGAAESGVMRDTGAEAVSAAAVEKRRKLAVSLFLAILCDPDRDLRQAAAEALGRLGELRAEPALARALQDPDATVRSAAERALQLLTPARGHDKGQQSLEPAPPGPGAAEPGEVRIEEIVLCSGSGEGLYECESKSLELRSRLLEQIEQQAIQLTGLAPLGQFDRLEILTPEGRIVCQVQPVRRLFVRRAGTAAAVA